MAVITASIIAASFVVGFLSSALAKRPPNVAYSETVQEIINKNHFEQTCTKDLQSVQTIRSDFDEEIVLRGDCAYEVSNNIDLKAGCDMSLVSEEITSQDTQTKIRQKSAVVSGANISNVENSEVINNLNRIVQSCNTIEKAQQNFTENVNEVLCEDKAKITRGNKGTLEASCMLATAGKIDAEQVAKTKIEQEQSGLFGLSKKASINLVIVFFVVLLGLFLLLLVKVFVKVFKSKKKRGEGGGGTASEDGNGGEVRDAEKRAEQSLRHVKRPSKKKIVRDLIRSVHLNLPRNDILYQRAEINL